MFPLWFMYRTLCFGRGFLMQAIYLHVFIALLDVRVKDRNRGQRQRSRTRRFEVITVFFLLTAEKGWLNFAPLNGR